LLLTVSCLFSCADDSSSKVKDLDLENLYKNYGVDGCFLLQSLKDDQVYVYNSNRCEQGFLPASTFKIVNSMIALESGVAADENLLIKWDSVVRQVPVWNQDHTMKTAFQVSCVPYYQALAAKIGVSKMQEWVNKLQYGKMDVRNETLTDFWLKGKSEITPYQQLDFLARLAKKELPIKPSTVHKINDIMTIASDSTGMIMRGKTGWAIVGERSIGWFVGSIDRPDGERFIFVNNIESKLGAIPDNDFMMIRKSIVGEVLSTLDVIKSLN